MTNPELAKDPGAFLDHLKAQLDSLIRAGAALDAASGPGTATDPTGNVTVEFTDSGRLAALTVAPSWEGTIPAQELVTVINQTLVTARDSGAVDAPAAELTDEEVVAIRERGLARRREAMAVDRSDEEYAALAEGLPAEFDRITREFRNAIDNADQYRVTVSDEPGELATEQVLSDNQMVAIELSDGVPVRVAINENWLPGRSGIVLSESFAEIIPQLPPAAARQDH